MEQLPTTLKEMSIFEAYYADYFSDYFVGSLETVAGLEGPPSATFVEHKKPPSPSSRAKITPTSKGAMQRPFDVYGSPQEKDTPGASQYNTREASYVKR